VAAGDGIEGDEWVKDVTADVVVPYPDYSVPIERAYVTVGITGVGGHLLINATDKLILYSATNGGTIYWYMAIRGGSQIQSPRVDVPYPDYSVPVPEPEWS